MSNLVTPPPAVERTRDTPFIILTILSGLFLIAGILTLILDSSRVSMLFFILTVLGGVAAALRIFKSRRELNDADLRGEDNTTE